MYDMSEIITGIIVVAVISGIAWFDVNHSGGYLAAP